MTKAAGRAIIFSVALAHAALIESAHAGPNLTAIGHFGEMPYQRAIGRDSFSGGEILYEFDDPNLDFGRIVVRSDEPNSVVRRDLFVGYNGEGLIIDARQRESGRRNVRIASLEIWLRIQGEVRPSRDYAWEIEVSAANDVLDRGFPAVVPALWADGEPIGAEITVQRPVLEDPDRIQRLVVPTGIVKLPAFERQTGSAWVVLKPERFGEWFGVHRVSFRELDTLESYQARTDMPVLMHYIPIRDVLEDGIVEAISRSGAALTRAQHEDHFWAGESREESVLLTSLVVAALAEIGTDNEDLSRAMQWLAEQEPDDDEPPFSLGTIAARLYCLARHGGLKSYRRIIQADIQTLTHAQFDRGGWSLETRGDDPESTVTASSDNLSTAMVIRSLREAKFAGAVVESRAWRNVMQYWTEAQAYDGGFRQRLERFGGYGTGTTSAFTSMGAAALLTSLDMAAGVGGRRCNTFLASRKQLRTIDGALTWLDRRYRKPLGRSPAFAERVDPFVEPLGLQWLGEVSGVVELNGKNHFSASARELLHHYDRELGMFGLRTAKGEWAEKPNVMRTAQAVSILGAGAAPTICQRIVLGADETGWAEYNGDVAHLVRYIGDRRGRLFNWRRSSIDLSVRELAKVPILLLSVKGRFDWTPKEWRKIRDYCFAGGSVIIDVSEGQEAQREHVVAALAESFPEYRLEDLAPSAALFATESRLSPAPAVKALGNGLRYFVFLPAESWSCQWHLYRLREHEDAFALMNNLLTYATDDAPLPSSFAASTYPADARPSYFMKAMHLEIGGTRVAHPDMIRSLDRLLRAHYRLALEETTHVGEADLVWVSVTGDTPPSQAAIGTLREVIERGTYLLIDVAGGDAGRDEMFRGLLRTTWGVSLERLRHTDPVINGKIPGSQGFDVLNVAMRQALHTRFSTHGRCDLWGIVSQGKRTGVYSAHDIVSGIGYEYFPGCRGPMPAHARRIAMNACLMAYLSKTGGQASPQASIQP